MTKSIELSGLNSLRYSEYTCAHEWPDDCKLQGGDMGLVFTKDGSYETAFFEAFPRNPRTFIRGEGKTVAEAEESCWAQYQRYLACPAHEYEAQGYRNGVGICKHCGMAGFDVIPGPPCCICGTPTWHERDKNNIYYCEAHERDMPLSSWSDVRWEWTRMLNSIETDRILRRKDDEMIAAKLHPSSPTTGTFDGNGYTVTVDGGVWSISVRDAVGATLYEDTKDYGGLSGIITMDAFIRYQFLQFMERERECNEYRSIT